MEEQKRLPAYYKECHIPPTFSINSLFTFSKQSFSKDFVSKGEAHNFMEVVCVLEGKVGITADKNVYMLSKGQMIIHPPQEFHAIWSTDGTTPEAIFFSFRANGFPNLSKRIFALKIEDIAYIRALQSEASSAFNIKIHSISMKEGQEKRASIIAKKLEIFLLKAFSSEMSEKPEYIGKSAENYVKILSVMQDNLEKPLSTKELAVLCNMSVPSMEKTIFRYLGCGVIACFNAMKIQSAKDMLSLGKSVKETALSLGFSNQNYFSSKFKSAVGVSPSHWQKES